MQNYNKFANTSKFENFICLLKFGTIKFISILYDHYSYRNVNLEQFWLGSQQKEEPEKVDIFELVFNLIFIILKVVFDWGRWSAIVWSLMARRCCWWSVWWFRAISLPWKCAPNADLSVFPAGASTVNVRTHCRKLKSRTRANCCFRSCNRCLFVFFEHDCLLVSMIVTCYKFGFNPIPTVTINSLLFFDSWTLPRWVPSKIQKTIIPNICLIFCIYTSMIFIHRNIVPRLLTAKDTESLWREVNSMSFFVYFIWYFATHWLIN